MGLVKDMIKTILAITLTTKLFAANTEFKEGDAFFYGSLIDKNIKEDSYRFNYCLDPVNMTLCGYEGISFLKIETRDEKFKKFIKWSAELDEKKFKDSHYDDTGKGYDELIRVQVATSFYFICSSDYDLNKHLSLIHI